jgi:hypothetical protein
MDEKELWQWQNTAHFVIMNPLDTSASEILIRNFHERGLITIVARHAGLFFYRQYHPISAAIISHPTQLIKSLT